MGSSYLMSVDSNGLADVAVFAIVGPDKTLLYEADLSGPGRREDTAHLDQFILYLSCDALKLAKDKSSALYLGPIERFNDFSVVAFTTHSNHSFLLLHKLRNKSKLKGDFEDAVKNFFNGVYEVFIRYMLNPFAEVGTIIAHDEFDMQIKSKANEHLSKIAKIGINSTSGRTLRVDHHF